MPKKAPSKPSVEEIISRLRTAMEQAPEVLAVDLVRRSHVDASGVSRLLNYGAGKRGLETPNLLAVLRAAAELDVSLDWVFTGAGRQRRTLVLAEEEKLVASFQDAIQTMAMREPKSTAQGGQDRHGEGPAPRQKRR